MSYDELQTQLILSDEILNNGDFIKAEQLVMEVLLELNPEGNFLQLDVSLDLSSFFTESEPNEILLIGEANRMLGIIAVKHKNYSVAREYFITSEKIYECINDQQKTVSNLEKIGQVYINNSEYSLSLEYFQKALKINEELGNKAGESFNNNTIGSIFNHLFDSTSALEYFQKALQINEDIGSKEGKAVNLSNIGLVYSTLSDYPLALEYFQRALVINEELGNKGWIATNLSSIGNVYWDLSDYPRALEFHQKALSINEKIGRKPEIASNLSDIGIVYFMLLDYTRALDYYQKALSINEELGIKRGVGINLTNIAGVYMNLCDYPLALECLQKSLSVSEEFGSKYGIALNLGNIGMVYERLTDYHAALENMTRALAIYEELDAKDGIGRNLTTIGAIYSSQKFEGYNADKAEEIFLRSIAICEEIGAKRNLYETLKLLADLYKTQNRWEECQRYYEKYHTTYIEVQNAEVSRQATLFEHRRKMEEAERDRQVKLARFQEQEKILHNMLPSQIADRIVSGEKMIADSHENVSVFFSDIVDFTKLSQDNTAENLVSKLNGIFTQFDQIARKHGLEKIKTIGDAYMAVCGAPTAYDNHAERAALFALEVIEMIDNYRKESGEKIQLRIGLHSGSVVAGVIGENKFAYDMWGDTVNTASRMESYSEPNMIHVSEDFVRAVEVQSHGSTSKSDLHFIPRGEMDIKGKGMMKTYFLENR